MGRDARGPRSRGSRGSRGSPPNDVKRRDAGGGSSESGLPSRPRRNADTVPSPSPPSSHMDQKTASKSPSPIEGRSTGASIRARRGGSASRASSGGAAWDCEHARGHLADVHRITGSAVHGPTHRRGRAAPARRARWWGRVGGVRTTEDEVGQIGSSGPGVGTGAPGCAVRSSGSS